jgi:Leucine-rich repeat (LRR) protein
MIKKAVAAFFSPLTNGFCTFYEKDSGERTVFIEYLNLENLDLKKLRIISRLHLPGNHITDISLLSLVKNIEYLNLAGNQITDITPLKELKNLNYLDIRNNPVHDPDTIEELKRRLGEYLLV